MGSEPRATDGSRETRQRFELPLEAGAGETHLASVAEDHSLGFLSLRRNVYWFIWLRWLVIIIFVVLGLAAVLGLLPAMGLHLRAGWLFVLALLLIVFNLGVGLHARQLRSERLGAVHLNLWSQIVVDLLALAVLVHSVGSQGTFAPFLFQVHIVLACIFFKRRESFLVLLTACLLYLAVIVLEYSGLLVGHYVFTSDLHPAIPARAQVMHVASALLLWTVVWALTSQLSTRLRQRQLEAIAAREQALRTWREGKLHLRHTAHQMKAPIDAMRSQLYLLLGGYGGELTKPTMDGLQRIEARCDGLADFVQDVLHLARLKVGEEQQGEDEPVDLNSVAQEVIERLQPKVEARQLHFNLQLNPATVVGNRESLNMLVDNLISNAITYSRDEGEIRIACHVTPAGQAELIVEDHGIGIAPEKLPRIFDEYYRTNEAKAHNAHSTGVGLAIVRQVAMHHGIQLTVESEPGAGTCFTCRFPVSRSASA